jgi:translin
MNHNLELLSDECHQKLDAIHLAREDALKQSRLLTRQSANAIRAIHRGEIELAEELISKAKKITDQLRKSLKPYPELYFSGYTQDSIKEYVEAKLTLDIIQGESISHPDELKVEIPTFLKGLSETVGELRRKCLDILRKGYSQDAENLLDMMDEIYSLLVTIDYPDAITHGLRRQTDLARSIIERTRGDLTTSKREEELLKSILNLQKSLDSKDKS